MAWTERPRGRSVQCNGELLKFFRDRRGLTQEELADLAELTTRVVAKAEGDGSVHPDTIEKIADVLTSATQPVFPEDLIASPKAIVRRILECYAQYERQCTVHCQKFLADDVSVIAPGDSSIIPFAGEHETIDGFDAFWGKLFAMLERHDKKLIVDSMRVVAEGNQVVVLTKEFARFKGISPALEPTTVTPITFLFEFEKGKLKRLEDHFDARSVEESITSILKRSANARKLHGKLLKNGK